MVTFAELKAKAEKVKDAGMTKVTNTRDRLSSTPSSKTTWDPNWKRAPPPPLSAASSSPAGTGGPPPSLPLWSRPDAIASGTAPPGVPRASRPSDDMSAPPRPPPSRVASGYPRSQPESTPNAGSEIDWANLSPEDKEAFFGWLDEFFSRHLDVELSPREARSVPASSTQTVTARAPPAVNKATRPQA